MKNLIIITICTLCTLATFGQRVFFYTQAQVDSLGTYSVINHDLILSSELGQDSATMINDLTPFLGVDSIYANLIIENTAITSLDGLQNLQYVNRLTIEDNRILLDASDLNFTGVVNELFVKYNANLLNLPDMANIKECSRLIVFSNDRLENIKFNFKSLGQVNFLSVQSFSFGIEENRRLKSCEIRNPSKEDMGFALLNNDSLTHLYVGDSGDSLGVYIEGNKLLDSITGFQNVKHGRQIAIENNDNLSRLCFVKDIIASDDYWTLSLVNNAPGANSVAEVSATDCSDFNTSVQNVEINELAIYPNPTSDKMYVDGLKSVSIYQLFSISGRLIQSGMVNPNTPIDVSAMAKGLYVIQVNEKRAKLLVR